MRRARSLFVLLATAACQTSAAIEADPVRAPAEAALRRRDVALVDAVDLSPGAEVAAADERLLRDALRDLELRRRPVLENLTNATTPGYKRRVVTSRTTALRGSGDAPVPVPPGQAFYVDFASGPLQETNRALDWAVDGDGFFALAMPDGTTAFSRNSSWHVNADGKLVTREGWILLPEITVPSDLVELVVDPRGLGGGRTAGSPDCLTRFGQLTLHRFVNPAGLRQSGSVWVASDESGAPITGSPGDAGFGVLRQGCTEGANVDVAAELAILAEFDRQRRALLQVLQGLARRGS